MIKIDSSKCNACELCTEICHEHCMAIDNGTLTIDYTYCSTCAQCIAICPQQALTWDNHEPELFNKSLYPDPAQIEELLKERRTIRNYTNEKIDKSVLEDIAGYAIYAPTHNFNLRTIIIDDEQIINQMDDLICKFSVQTYKWLYKPRFIHSLIKILAPDREFEYLKAKPKLEIIQKRNKGLKSKPAAIIMIAGDKRVPLTSESAQYALYNIDLYAQTRGIACRNLVGNQMIFNRNKKFRKLIGLDRNEKIFGTITMGIPAVKFINKITGKKIKIQWNTIKN
jgi:NAD-dependent dihydropyrimidine dehydrogenase PreA subunit/nitroreductase